MQYCSQYFAYVYILTQSYILNSFQSTLQHLQMQCLHYCMKYYYYPHFTVEEKSTERLSNLPEITQPVSSRASIRSQAGWLQGSLGRIAPRSTCTVPSAMRGLDARGCALQWFTAQAKGCSPVEK